MMSESDNLPMATMGDEVNASPGVGPTRANADDSSKTQQRMPSIAAAVVSLYSSIVIEIRPNLVHNMRIMPSILPISTFVLETHSRDNRNPRNSLAACLNLAPSRSMCWVGTKLLQVSPAVAMRRIPSIRRK